MRRAKSRSEVVVPCRSTSERSEAAARVADGLARERHAELGTPDEVTDADQVVTVDGCSSACGARLFEARGVRTVASLTLDALDVERRPLQETVAEASRLVDRGVHPKKTRRPAPGVAPRQGEAHSVGDYLLAIDWLTSPVGSCGALVETPTIAAHVSARLGVSRPTAGEMLTRLEREGLIERGAARDVMLTPLGRAAADRVVHAHRVLECFAVDTLGYAAVDCYTQARHLAPAFDDEAIDRLDEAMGHPARCPHGWPVDPAAGRTLATELISLSALPVGAAATVELLPETDLGELAILLACGLAPGTRLVRKGNAGQAPVVRIGRRDLPIAQQAAALALVRA